MYYLYVTEGGDSKTLTLNRLTSKPQEDVKITVDSTECGNGFNVVPTTITVPINEWNKPINFTITLSNAPGSSICDIYFKTPRYTDEVKIQVAITAKPSCKYGEYYDDKSTKCTVCDEGKYTDKETGYSTCIGCDKGKYGNSSGLCSDCDKGKYQDIESQTDCKTCNNGFVPNLLKTGCLACEVGKIQEGSECVKCPDDLYQDKKSKTECKECRLGWTPNDASTDCQKPTWKVPSDCDYINQYLNNSSTNKNDHTCSPCPLGASCEGDITWSGVRAKYGWWRVLAAEDRTHPPPCLLNADSTDTSPPCAFVACLYPHACLGAKNPGKFTFADGTDPATIDHNETCLTINGYKINGCDNIRHITNDSHTTLYDLLYPYSITLNSTRCRLCGTCQSGYKRSGSGTQCQKCPNSSTNRAFLGVGFFVMTIGSTILIYMTIKEEGGADDVSE